MTRRNVQNQGWISRYFLPTPMTDWALIFTGFYEVWAFGKYCLPKVSNEFNGLKYDTQTEIFQEMFSTIIIRLG